MNESVCRQLGASAPRSNATVATDDGAQSRMGGALTIDARDATGFPPVVGAGTLDQRDVPLRLKYRDGSRTAEVTLLWSGAVLPLWTAGEGGLTVASDRKKTPDTRTRGPLVLIPEPATACDGDHLRHPLVVDPEAALFDALGGRVMLFRDVPMVLVSYLVGPDV